jgi:hypothetical protein
MISACCGIAVTWLWPRIIISNSSFINQLQHDEGQSACQLSHQSSTINTIMPFSLDNCNISSAQKGFTSSKQVHFGAYVASVVSSLVPRHSKVQLCAHYCQIAIPQQSAICIIHPMKMHVLTVQSESNHYTSAVKQRRRQTASLTLHAVPLANQC